jgi:Fur family transcriptional regulator, zinc uptake regulator
MHAEADGITPGEWRREVEGACARHGLALTPLRQSVLGIVSESPAPLGAYAIIEALSRREGKSIAPPTVYRTLEFFLEHGFLHKIESRNAYARCAHFDHAHESAQLICEKCGRSEEVEDTSLAAALDAAAARLQFRPKRRLVEMIGLCRDCAQAA